MIYYSKNGKPEPIKNAICSVGGVPSLVLEAYIGVNGKPHMFYGTTPAVFGVVWDYSKESTRLTRLTRLSDPHGFVTVDITEEPVPAVGTGPGSSPFDTYMPWAGMDEVNIVDGKVTYRRGNVGFSRTEYDTMVSVPAFFYRIIDDPVNSKRYFYVSDRKVKGLSLHPAFDRGDGRKRNYIYLGRYLSSMGDINPDDPNFSGSYSKASKTPYYWLTRKEAWELAREKGAGWYSNDYVAWCAVWLLYLVEFADWDSQNRIGHGWTNVETYERWTNAGGTDLMTYHTGKANKDEKKGHAQIQYRHLEDIWGNEAQILHGINFFGDIAYICLNPANYSDAKSSKYINTGILLNEGIQGRDIIQQLGFSELAPFAFLPSKGISVGSTSPYYGKSVFIPDHVWAVRLPENECHTLAVGGHGRAKEDAGMFCFTVYYKPDEANARYASRLLYLHP